tara:strand:- start:3815 stop:4534 length:720 start_codon:yes stop_codon:yes gene_type:complete
VTTALDELIEAQSDLLAAYCVSASEKWEMPQGAFEDLLASSPRIQGCDDWDAETFWTDVVEAERRRQPLLWLQRSTRFSQGEHVIVTFSKPTPATRASRKRKRTARLAGMLEEQHQRALRSNRAVRANTSSSSSSVGQAAYRFTTSMKDVWHWVKSGIGNVVESWTTKEMERGEKKFMDSLANFKIKNVRCQFCHEHHFTKNTTQAQVEVCPKCVYDPNLNKQKNVKVTQPLSRVTIQR